MATLIRPSQSDFLSQFNLRLQAATQLPIACTLTERPALALLLHDKYSIHPFSFHKHMAYANRMK